MTATLASPTTRHEGDLDWGVWAWDPAKHPRDRRGRFTRSRTVDLTDDEKATARSIVAGLKPKKFGTAQDQADYLNSRAKLPAAQRNAVERYSGDAFLRINRGLRAGKDDGDGEAATVDGLRAAMAPTEDDLILTRTVGLEAFGSVPIEDLAGKKVKDAGFSSVSLGHTYGGNLGNVQMKIAVPKGTPAIFAAPYSSNPLEREVILPDGMELAVASVKKNDRFGYDMTLIVLPKAGPDDAATGDDQPPTTNTVRAVAVCSHGHPLRNADDDEPDLSAMQTAWEKALAALLAAWEAITAGWRSELRKQITEIVDDGELARLAAMTVDTGDGADRLHEALTAIAATAAQQASDEAADAGVTAPATVPESEALAATAAAVAAMLGAGLGITAGQEALRRHDGQKTGMQVASEVDAVLREQPDRPQRDAFGAALHGTQNRARVETFAAASEPDADGTPGPVGSLYHDGQLDGRQCPACKAATGRFVCNTDDLGPYHRLFTAIGGYVDCYGREKCRCTVTGVWRKGADE